MPGCSFLTEFVVVNESERAVEVSYKVKKYPGQFSPPVPPSTLPASQLSSKWRREWTKLDDSQIRLDENNRTVTVRLNPHDALFVADMHNYFGHDDPRDAENFPIDEIGVIGSDGEVKLAGDQARRGFLKVSQTL